MPGAQDSPDRSARPRLPRQAKLPKTPSRPPHHRLTRATAPASASAYLSSPVSSGQLTESDDDEPPQQPSASAKKRRAVSGIDTSIIKKRRQRSPVRRSPRSGKVKVSYAESESDTDLSDIGDTNYYDNLHQDYDDDVDDGSPGKTSRLSRPSPVRKELKTSRIYIPIKAKKIEGPPVKKNSSYLGNVLPYHVWCRVFDHIASPLLDPEARREDVVQAMRELLRASFLGKLVYEPAMVALYRCPPILDQCAFRLLSDTLSQPPDSTLINYRPKVETLRIDVDLVLYRKYGGSYLFLDDIVPYLPRLMDLELFHPLDDAPYRELDNTVRYRYPHNLLRVLGSVSYAVEEGGDKTAPTELRSWRWNARLAGDVFPLNELKIMHTSPSFATLRKIAFVNYQLPSSLSKSISPDMLEEDKTVTADLAAAIRALPRLEHLIVESSTVADSKLLNLLPTTLKRLELVNCWEVTSDDLANFLCSHGSLLERLTLKHCISLSMGFISVLERACPKLTHLHMNLLYYRAHEHFNDADPVYDRVLGRDEVPKWPTSIQSIEIDYMRFDSLKIANMFFNSLVTSAPKLPNLRRLVLGAKIDVSLRERTNFRNTWIERMSDVFERQDDPPVSVYSRNAGMPKNRHRDLRSDGRDLGPKSPKAPARRSTRRVDNPPSPSSPSSDSDVVTQKNSAMDKALARQLQWSMREIPASRYRVVDDESSEDELAGDPDGQIQPGTGFIHGLCDLVEIKVDNQKPTENQRCMEDFLDQSVDESDAEWNGDESEEEDPVIE